MDSAQGSQAETSPATPANPTPSHDREATSYLHERGLTPEIANWAGIAAVLSAKATHPGFKDAPALTILYVDPWTGEPATFKANGVTQSYQRVRYLNPGAAKGFVPEAKPQRFEQPKDSPVFAYFTPGGFVDWFSVLTDPTVPLVVTEGEIKGLCGCANGIPTIALGGVWNFQNNGVFLPELERIAWAGRRAIICYDSDIADKPDVLRAEMRLTRELLNRGAAVHLARLPSADDGSKVGLDDAIVQFGRQQVIDFLLSAPEAPDTVIELAPHRLNENLEELDKALAASGLPIFQRSGTVVHVSAAGDLEDGDDVRRVDESPVVRQATATAVQQLAMRATTFVKWNQRSKNLVRAECPGNLAEHYIGKVGGWNLPHLRGIVEAPTIRPDGTILQTPGYDPKSGFFYVPSTEFPPIPDAPTRDDALAAVDKLRHVVRGFEFASPESEATWIAAVLTAVVRRSLRTAPLFALSAPVMGAGKTLAADLISIIATGHEPAVMSQGRNPEEDRKRLLSVLMRGDAVVQIDNCEVPIEGDALCAILTSTEWQDRVLGRSEILKVPTNATFLATGNNLAFRGDMSTRALVCKILPAAERPEERVFEWDARAEARAQRPELVAAALTIIRAYDVAGRPAVSTKPFGRFEQWQAFIQHGLLWLGAPDPCKTRELAERNDSERETFARLIHLWSVVFGTNPIHVKDIGGLDLPRVGQPPEARELYDLACEVSGGRGRDVIDVTALGKYLASKEERLSGGFRLVKGEDRKRKVMTWQLLEAR
jgi:hypothetical protein